MVINMIGPKCPVLERDEQDVIDNKEVKYINNNHKNEFKFWLREKGYGE